jgi:hypothetical protein
MKKLVWTALAALVTTAAATASLRILRYAWRRTTHEEPPEKAWWANLFVGKPVQVGVKKAALP